MNKNIKISVLMPVYNSQDYIDESIESILNQTFGDFEFIIINDGSTDNTADIIRRYKDARIRFIDNKQNRGLIAVLNQGLDLCNGEYIARMDSDDISLPTRFEKQIAYMDANPDVGILGTAGQNFGANNDVNYSPDIVDAIELLKNVGFYHPSVMMRKSVLDKYNLRYDPNYYLVEDYELWTRALHVTKLRNLPDVLIKYRVHSSSVSNANSVLQENNKGIVRQKLLDFITNDSYMRNIILSALNVSYYKIPSKRVYLFNFLPLLDITYKSVNNIKLWLFKFIPLLKIKYGDIRLFHFIPIGKIKKNITHKPDDSRFCPFNIDNSVLKQELQNLPEFTYIPNSGNLGDMIIAKSTLDFFDANNIKYHMFDGTNASDVIVYGGGGQWTADYEYHWQKWLNIFRTAHKIIILPSSFYNCQHLIDILDERFVVFCREMKSYNYIKSANTGAKVILDHDMALRMTHNALRGNIQISHKKDRYAIEQIKNAIQFPRTVVKFNRTDCESAGHWDTDLDLSGVRYGDATSSKEHIEFCTKLMLMAVDCADAIITDRLHVGIAAALMGKEVFLLDNTYGKLSGVYNHSLKQNPHIHFCTTMPDIQTIRPQPTNKDNFRILMEL